MPDYKPIKSEYNYDDISSQLYPFIALAITSIVIIVVIVLYCSRNKTCSYHALRCKQASNMQLLTHGRVNAAELSSEYTGDGTQC